MNLEIIRERFLRDNFEKRLGALAANLARISSFSRGTPNPKIIKRLLEESKFFIEWTLLEAPLSLQEKLVELQVRLAVWCCRLNEGKDGLENLARESEEWSEQILSASGLGH